MSSTSSISPPPTPTGAVENTASTLPPAVLGGLIAGAVFIIVLFVLGWYYCIRPTAKEVGKKKRAEAAAKANREAVQIVVEDPKDESKRRVKITEPDTKPSAPPSSPPTTLPAGITGLTATPVAAAPIVATPIVAPVAPVVPAATPVPDSLEKAVTEAADAVAASAPAPTSTPATATSVESTLSAAVVTIPVPGVARTVTERRTGEAAFEEDEFEDGQQIEPVAT